MTELGTDIQKGFDFKGQSLFYFSGQQGAGLDWQSSLPSEMRLLRINR